MKYFLLSLIFFVPVARAANPDLSSCWAAWTAGDIEISRTCAQQIPASGVDTDSLHQLRMKISFVKGNFVQALDEFQLIRSGYSQYKSAVGLALQAYHHLGLYQTAYELAQSTGAFDSEALAMLQQMALYPASYHLKDMTIIPFKQDAINPYMPSFEMELAGQKLAGQIDTGANYVAVSPQLAKQLGIKSVYIGMGNANDRATKMWLGHADFRLGGLEVKNVPVYVLESLGKSEVEDRPIFGTSILSHFLVTMDYPGQRMILSPQGTAAKQKHFGLLPKPTTEMDFYLWADHYMFARGSLDAATSLNFFVDTGLFAVDAAGKQAAIYGMSETFRRWGYSEDELRSPLMDLHGSLRLGPLVQADHTAYHTDGFPTPSLGGVQIHALIAHAFLKKYVWTIDFETRKYFFSE